MTVLTSFFALRNKLVTEMGSHCSKPFFIKKNSCHVGMQEDDSFTLETGKKYRLVSLLVRRQNTTDVQIETAWLTCKSYNGGQP